MTDDRSMTATAGRAQINRKEDYEIRHWAAKLGVSKGRLLAAIGSTGPMAADVTEQLGKRL